MNGTAPPEPKGTPPVQESPGTSVQEDDDVCMDEVRKIMDDGF